MCADAISAIECMVIPQHREVPCSEYHAVISMAGKYPAIDDGEADDRVEAKLVHAPSNALPGAIVDPTWVAR